MRFVRASRTFRVFTNKLHRGHQHRHCAPGMSVYILVHRSAEQMHRRESEWAQQYELQRVCVVRTLRSNSNETRKMNQTKPEQIK